MLLLFNESTTTDKSLVIIYIMIFNIEVPDEILVCMCKKHFGKDSVSYISE